MHTIALLVAALMATAGTAVIAWRIDPRRGSGFMNAAVNPWLLRMGLTGGRHSEIAPLEHVGRASGTRRLTPVHPEPTDDGFRIVVPLGDRSQWARNVMAAGRCRIQLHGQVYELDQPRMVAAREAAHLPGAVRAAMAALGFEYLVLRTLAVERGKWLRR